MRHSWQIWEDRYHHLVRGPAASIGGPVVTSLSLSALTDLSSLLSGGPSSMGSVSVCSNQLTITFMWSSSNLLLLRIPLFVHLMANHFFHFQVGRWAHLDHRSHHLH